MAQSAFLQSLYHSHQQENDLPAPKLVADWLDGLMELLFPAYRNVHFDKLEDFERAFAENQHRLLSMLSNMQSRLPAPAHQLQQSFELGLPQVHTTLVADANAILAGDPAATTLIEVLRTYPGFYAIAVYRIAHALDQLDVPLLPRMLTEIAHGRTGIDIHPKAVIGNRFCIDHGTGIVIGETVVIGEDVKLYQGVTLGALSVRKELAQTKRHPTIGNRVIIYASATILGGNTIIGDDAIIGGNTWIVKSVPAGERVYYKTTK